MCPLSIGWVLSPRGGVCGVRQALWWLGVAGWLVGGCSRGVAPGREAGQPAEPRAPAQPPVTAETVQAFKLGSRGEDGRLQWEILGKTADLMAEAIALTDLTATSYGKKTTVTLTARAGVFDRRRRDIQLREDVKAVTTEGTTLTTDWLDWEADRQMARTEAWTTVARDTLTVHGRGAVAWPQFKRILFHREVQVEVKPDTQITCAGPLEVDYERRWARFHRQVHIQDPRGEIWADRMDVRLDPVTRQVAEVECWGHVRLQREAQVAAAAEGGRTTSERQVAWARRALYRRAQGTMIMIGHPRMTFSTMQESPLT